MELIQIFEIVIGILISIVAFWVKSSDSKLNDLIEAINGTKINITQIMTDIKVIEQDLRDLKHITGKQQEELSNLKVSVALLEQWKTNLNQKIN